MNLIKLCMFLLKRMYVSTEKNKEKTILLNIFQHIIQALCFFFRNKEINIKIPVAR